MPCPARYLPILIAASTSPPKSILDIKTLRISELGYSQPSIAVLSAVYIHAAGSVLRIASPTVSITSWKCSRTSLSLFAREAFLANSILPTTHFDSSASASSLSPLSLETSCSTSSAGDRTVVALVGWSFTSIMPPIPPMPPPMPPMPPPMPPIPPPMPPMPPPIPPPMPPMPPPMPPIIPPPPIDN